MLVCQVVFYLYVSLSGCVIPVCQFEVALVTYPSLIRGSSREIDHIPLPGSVIPVHNMQSYEPYVPIVVTQFALNREGTTHCCYQTGNKQSILLVDLHIWGFLFPLRIQAVLECVYSPTVNYIIGQSIPGYCNFDGSERNFATVVLSNLFTIILFPLFLVIIEVVVKEPSCTNIIKYVQIFENLDELFWKSSLSWFFESLLVAMVLELWNHFCIVFFVLFLLYRYVFRTFPCFYC